MSKLILMICTLVILATILSNHSVQSQRSKPSNHIPWNHCICTFQKNNIVTLKTRHPKVSGLYSCEKQDNGAKPKTSPTNKKSGNSLDTVPMPF
ncbi:hypothetical protein AMELA_G00062280 [Ameiurus melas]|uniref:Uncharacterized protein n=1 Tax=Ameiurus melas TaxID=219545 RepID=A0A7J6B1U9_AMEME|nr:hypothetical protein AMELA_G00062280 [Ameiurus melas]